MRCDFYENLTLTEAGAAVCRRRWRRRLRVAASWARCRSSSSGVPRCAGAVRAAVWCPVVVPVGVVGACSVRFGPGALVVVDAAAPAPFPNRPCARRRRPRRARRRAPSRCVLAPAPAAAARQHCPRSGYKQPPPPTAAPSRPKRLTDVPPPLPCSRV